MRRIVLGALAALALAAAPTAAATTPKTTLHAIEVQVMCVSCHVPLEVAESPEADQERLVIQGLIDRGETVAQIRHQLVVDYGVGVLALPPDHGFNVLFYILPIAALLLALALLAVLVPRWRRRGVEPPPSPPTVSAADSARLDADLERYRR